MAHLLKHNLEWGKIENTQDIKTHFLTCVHRWMDWRNISTTPWSNTILLDRCLPKWKDSCFIDGDSFFFPLLLSVTYSNCKCNSKFCIYGFFISGNTSSHFMRTYRSWSTWVCCSLVLWRSSRRKTRYTNLLKKTTEMEEIFIIWLHHKTHNLMWQLFIICIKIWMSS